METIVWEQDEELLPTDALLASDDRVVIGSKFTGLPFADIPEWLKSLAINSAILNISGTIHFYTGNQSGWCPLRSKVTLCMLVKSLELYAPVNFATAAEPYVVLIESIPWPVVMLSNTFTQGRLRYTYTVDEDTGVVHFVPNNVLGGELNPKNTLCSVPVSNVNPILQFNIRYASARARKDGAIAWLYGVFGENIITMLWALGDMLYDSSNKRMFILYGPGGVGKTTVANIMNAVIGGTIPSLSSDLVAVNLNSFRRDALDSDDMMRAASSRLVTLGDVEPRPNDVLHMQNIKVLTGGDEVNGVKVHTTLVMTTNRLFHYDDLNDYVRPDRLRRVVVVPSVAERDGANVDFPPTDQQSLDELVQFAVRTRIKHKRPPVRPDALLASLFQSRYTEALELVSIDTEAALFECMEATMLLCWRFNIEISDLSGCLKWVGCCCAVESGGVYFIAKIKPLAGVDVTHMFGDGQEGYNPAKRARYYKGKPPAPLFPT